MANLMTFIYSDQLPNLHWIGQLISSNYWIN